VLDQQAMGTSPNTIDFILDQLSALPKVRARKMFGEYALYCDEKVVALVCDDQLFVKITKPGQALLGEDYPRGNAYPGAKPSLLISADDLEDDERLCALIRLTADALPAPKIKKPRTLKTGR
jgi:TfoX/Sxy family transcriptional regulator of competence genes